MRLSTSLGDIDVELRPDAAPKNVANFLSYVNSGAYSNTSFIHRSVPGFVIQGGGYYYSNGQIEAIMQQQSVASEFNLSNVRGTLAMAQVASNGATSQWFFNLADNSASLDSQNGGYTVIGAVANASSLAVIDAIASLQIVNDGAPFDALPVMNYTSGAVTTANLVISPISMLPSHAAFFNGEQSVGNAVNYLAFPNGNYFGYYSYLSNPNYIYHFDLGYEYVFDANDGQSGVYFYDFESGHFFYTSPTFPFPYIYDFSLNSVVYYYPDTNNAQHYTTNPRYFYEFKTGSIITQ